MSDPTRTIVDAGVGRRVPTITRRSAIGTGLAGLLAAGSAPPVRADQPLPQATVVNLDELGDLCRAIHAEYLAMWRRALAIGDELSASLTPEQRTLFNQYSDRASDAETIHSGWLFTEVGRHLPAFAPIVLMLQEHIHSVAYQKPGACCTLADGFER